MSKPLLLLDVSYLCHRAYHVMGALSYGDEGTGVVFGILQDIVRLQEQFDTPRCVFVFDRGRSKRHELLPGYKGSRRKRYAEATEEEQAARKDFQEQIRKLHDDYLPSAGFKNIFSAKGYEADDIIAQIAQDVSKDDEVVIVGSDHDLWQCLRPNVWCWNPYKRQAYTIELFKKQWGLPPDRWNEVKAYAGCRSDDIPGVPGVGEPTAAKFLRGAMNKKTATYKKIVAFGPQAVFNMRLVSLPFRGTPKFKIVPDEVTEEKWKALADRLGMKSIRSMVPVSAARKSRGRKRAKVEPQGFGLV